MTHLTESELEDAARRVLHARTIAEAGAAVDAVPEDQITRVLELAADMETRRVQFLGHVEAVIAEHGYMVQAVMGDATGPWFAYTAGLYPDRPAEVIARGFGAATHNLVYAAVRWADEGDIRLEPGDYTVPEGGAVRVVPWAGPPEDLAVAISHHRDRGRTGFPVLHIIASDDQGRFPGDPGCTTGEHQMHGIGTHP